MPMTQSRKSWLVLPATPTIRQVAAAAQLQLYFQLQLKLWQASSQRSVAAYQNVKVDVSWATLRSVVCLPRCQLLHPPVGVQPSHPLLVHLIYHNLHVSHALLYMNCMQFISICIIYYFAQTQRPKLFLSGWPNLLLGPCSSTTTTTTSRVQLISMATWSTTIIIKEMLNKANSTGPIPCNEDWVMTQVFST